METSGRPIGIESEVTLKKDSSVPHRLLQCLHHLP